MKNFCFKKTVQRTTNRFSACSKNAIPKSPNLLQRNKSPKREYVRALNETRAAKSASFETEQGEMQEKLVEIINSAGLQGREKTIIFKGFGLAGENKKALAAIAKELGVTPARVWEIEQRALQKLRGNRELRVLFESILEK